MSTCRQPLIPPLYYFFIFHFLFLYSFSSHCSQTHITITSYASHNSPFSISGPFTITLHTNFTKITITQIITSITVTHLQESQDSLHTFTRTSITHLQRITRIGKKTNHELSLPTDSMCALCLRLVPHWSPNPPPRRLRPHAGPPPAGEVAPTTPLGRCPPSGRLRPQGSVMQPHHDMCMRLPEREREECEKERAIEKEEKDKVGSKRR